MLVKRLDASDARLGQLDGIERGLTDLLVHIEQMRGANGKGEAGIKAKSAPGDTMQRDLAEIKQSERRTQIRRRSLSRHRRACRRPSRHESKATCAVTWRRPRQRPRLQQRSRMPAAHVWRRQTRPNRCRWRRSARCCGCARAGHRRRPVARRARRAASRRRGAAADRSEFASRSSARTRLRGGSLAPDAGGGAGPRRAGGRDRLHEFQAAGYPRSWLAGRTTSPPRAAPRRSLPRLRPAASRTPRPPPRVRRYPAI